MRLNKFLNLIMICTFLVILVKLEYTQTSIAFILPISKYWEYKLTNLIEMNNYKNTKLTNRQRSSSFVQ